MISFSSLVWKHNDAENRNAAAVGCSDRFAGASLRPFRNNPEPDHFSAFSDRECCALTNGIVIDAGEVHQLHLAIEWLFR